MQLMHVGFAKADDIQRIGRARRLGDHLGLARTGIAGIKHDRDAIGIQGEGLDNFGEQA